MENETQTKAHLRIFNININDENVHTIKEMSS